MLEFYFGSLGYRVGCVEYVRQCKHFSRVPVASAQCSVCPQSIFSLPVVCVYPNCGKQELCEKENETQRKEDKQVWILTQRRKILAGNVCFANCLPTSTNPNSETQTHIQSLQHSLKGSKPQPTAVLFAYSMHCVQLAPSLSIVLSNINYSWFQRVLENSFVIKICLASKVNKEESWSKTREHMG